jgi:hypothetical protein
LIKVVADSSIIYKRMWALPSNVNRRSRCTHGKPPKNSSGKDLAINKFGTTKPA